MNWCRALRLAGFAVAVLWSGLVPEAGAVGAHIGYLYPAGGRKGTEFEVTAGGQFLQGVQQVVVSGGGVSVTVERHVKPLNQKQLNETRRNLTFQRQRLQAEAAGRKPPPTPEDLPPLPDHPWLEGAAGWDLAGLEEFRLKVFDPKRQPNAQIAETVTLRVSIAADARPGDRELRLLTQTGLSNPLCFHVGTLPETLEADVQAGAVAPPSTLSVPVSLNGQILPGDVDRFRFHARKGQQVLVNVRARRLIPYLADAVPGWFQAVVTLYDAKGNEIAYADDHEFHPDPILRTTIPETGDYEVEIHDAIYRGREDFVYRIALLETSGGRLPGAFRPTRRPKGFAAEREPNDGEAQAEPIRLPHRVQARIQQVGDVDRFRFEGKAGEEIVAEVFARRQLASPMDALIRLVDEQGTTVGWNDDSMEKDGHLHLGAGLLTHHADAYLHTSLPQDGVYTVCVADAQGHGGPAYEYRLRVTPPEPDFALRVTPSSLFLPAGRTAQVDVHVQFRDGFREDIQLALVDAPPGFRLDGATIPAGRNRFRVTLTAPPRKPAEPVALRLEGRARVLGREIRRRAVPADDTMQAFLWRHLMPARQWLVAVGAPKGTVPMRMGASEEPIRIAAGTTADIRFRAGKNPQIGNLEWALIDAPAGISLGKVRLVDGELVLPVSAAESGPAPGTRENLIVEAFRRPKGGGARQKNRWSLGVLPAIPVQIAAAGSS